MMNLFKRKQSNQLPPELESREVRIIGPRRAGKTTFLAALAHLPKLEPEGFVKSVESRDNTTEELVEMARDILETGSDFAPTDISRQPLYSFDISLKPSSRNFPLISISKPTSIRVSCREYAGEFLSQLCINKDSEDLSSFIDDCSFASGLILLIDATASKSDAEYGRAFEILQRELKQRLQRQGIPLNDYRIALVLSKCEQSEIWVHRKDLDRFIELKFFETQSAIARWKNDWNCTTNSFFCSAFGMKGSNPPRANVKVLNKAKGITRAVIDSPEFWRPFGLVAPLYWLQTGIDDRKFREI
ncbi:MAG: hypothetical protein RMZ41_002820 [Nostoc sp. DedVER02]|uniref:hypothetical protein n=1 Tax=unclassified Nostoc TaxID=2593658 RepID=UPI002AD22740|nr:MULTISPECIES: hypothetical protein [unclassified Nostoc]MDZ7986908.1 hypothetical protein [Nostoc sp. DedVER02]MDZ8115810.1 hypothetical protein [Nostoc sp. DedVER01b]